AKDVLDQKTFNTLDNVVSIDHYVSDPQNMADYVDYFSQKYHTKVLVSEFGAPIPDLNGSMTEKEQADFVNVVFENLYKKSDNVIGVNYYVLSNGTTALLNDNYTPRQAFDIVTNYFTPAVVQGTVINTLGDPVKEVIVKTEKGYSKTKTDSQGHYSLFIPPPRSVTIIAGGNAYDTKMQNVFIKTKSKELTYNFTLVPLHPSPWYKIRFLWKQFVNR
ncbi:MAG: glycosyl hydrolase, partial [Candidatus Levybacteria bacterium]|nr:glycosyl hydrolase [Candidatus Levybacteria bacterium]